MSSESVKPTSLLRVSLKPGEARPDHGATGNHHDNFNQCLRSRPDPIAPDEAGHQASCLGVITEISIKQDEFSVEISEVSLLQPDRGNAASTTANLRSCPLPAGAWHWANLR